MKHGVLIDRELLLSIGNLLDTNISICRIEQKDLNALHLRLSVAISSAPDAVIPVTKHQCYTCYANYDGKCMPAQESCDRYAYDEGSGAPDWCPQITKE